MENELFAAWGSLMFRATRMTCVAECGSSSLLMYTATTVGEFVMGLEWGPREGKRSDGCADQRFREGLRKGCSGAGMRIENPRRPASPIRMPPSRFISVCENH